jgi:hypothetical protein
VSYVCHHREHLTQDLHCFRARQPTTTSLSCFSRCSSFQFLPSATIRRQFGGLSSVANKRDIGSSLCDAWAALLTCCLQRYWDGSISASCRDHAFGLYKTFWWSTFFTLTQSQIIPSTRITVPLVHFKMIAVALVAAAAFVPSVLAHGGVLSYTFEGATYQGFAPYNSPTGQV